MDAAACYDEMPYGDYAFASTHPDRLAAVAALHGVTPPPLDSCRVLELGCASGGNLIPMAVTMPGAQFTGIDISPRQVARGSETITALRLENIRLETADILGFSAPPGSFDYILCHGVYSWVPPEVQRKVLEHCRNLLAPNGVAYISYNCLPGWHIRGMIRDMLRFHVRDIVESAAQIRECQNFLEFLPQAFPDPNQLYASLLIHEAKELASTPADYLYHEHLEAHNEPLYFSEFIRRTREHGLEFVAEADVFAFISRISPEVLGQLMNASSDHTEFEQYLDFLVARMFRKSLLVKAATKFSPSRREEALPHLYLSGRIRLKGELSDIASNSPAEFVCQGSGAVKTNHPLMKAALLALSLPGRLSFEELWATIAAQLALPAERRDEARAELAKMLLHCYSGRALDIHQQPAPFTLAPGTHPVASPYARWRASTGAKSLINLAHREVELGDLERLLLERLDGSRDYSDLRNDLLNLSREGVFEISEHGEPVTDPDRASPVLDEWIAAGVEHLAQTAFLLR